jgi:hypothetical protein
MDIEYSDCPINLSSLDTFNSYTNLALQHKSFEYTMPNFLIGEDFFAGIGGLGKNFLINTE